MRKKLKIEFVRDSFEKEGYKLLSDEYINGGQKLDYICSNGHLHSITYYNWYTGYRCPYCFYESVKINIEYIRAQLANEGYILLTDRYRNNKQKLNCVCNNGHNCVVTWAAWNSRGCRCRQCKYDNMAIKQTGSGNSNWKGGISCEPYCDVWIDKEFKESIKERDNYGCQNPDCWGTSKRLTVHHIDYVKKHCDPWNLITLCNSCNSRANFNREYHRVFYRTIMKKKYGNVNNKVASANE